MNTVLTAVPAATALIFLALLAWTALFLRRMWAELTAFVVAPNEGEESPLSLAMAELSQRFGRAAAMEIKTTLLGKESGLKRQEQALEGDIMSDALGAQNPLLASALDSFPTLKRRLLRNPALAGAALQILRGGKAPQGAAPQGQPSGNHQEVFKV